MKIGVTYLYTIFKYGYPPKPEDDLNALEEIAKMGFRYLELECLGNKHAEAVLKRRVDYKKSLDYNGIHVHNFCCVDPDLVSMDKAKRKAAYERFKQYAEIGIFFGTETLHLASYAPPVEYIGKAPYQLDEDYSFGDNFRLRIPNNFQWDRVWDVLVESCRFTAQYAAEHGKIIIMEPRVGEIVCSVDSMIRLINDVGMDNFKANFDTAHFSAQRENVPLALKKLEGKFANIHIADNNPVDTQHLPIGKGIIDWNEFFRLLKQMNYSGYMGLDLGSKDSIVEDLKSSVKYIEDVAKSLDLGVSY